MAQKNVLGKGFGAIFPDLIDDFDKKKPALSCGIEELSPNRYQPRKNFNDDDQKKLIASVKQSGIIQPIIVRKKADAGYEIIAGERRWRAAQAVGLKRSSHRYSRSDGCGISNYITNRKYFTGRFKSSGRSQRLRNANRNVQSFSGRSFFPNRQGPLDRSQYYPTS